MQFVTASSPHLSGPQSVTRVMGMVLLALVPGTLAMVWYFGWGVIINIGMVSGLLPVVGLPLPMISYGGTSIVTLMAGFGILMSIQTHRKLLPT